MRVLLLSFLSLAFFTLCAQSDFQYTPSEVVDGRVYQLLSFDSNLSAADHKRLASADIRLLGYRGDKTYLASLPAVSDLSTRFVGLDVQDVAALEVSQKMTIDKEAIPEYARDGADILVAVHYIEEVGHQRVIRKVEKAGYKVLESREGSPFLTLAIPPGELDALAAAPYLLAVELVPPPPVKEDRLGRNLHRVNKLSPVNGLGLDFNGSGVNLMVRDDGAVFDHIDFAGRMNQDFSGGSRGDHGDGVAGIMTGAGNLDPEFTGMAYGSDFWVIDYVSSFMDETMELVDADDIRVTNSSYSDGCNRGYTINTRTVDQQVYDNPQLMHVFSAGNDGRSDCGYGAGAGWGNITGGHKIGKNVIAVANLDPFGNVVGSSSRGPTQDGRLKPDIAANGFQHVSTAEEFDYMVFGGTSAAAPVVAGVMGILHQVYDEQYGEVGDAALLKSIMLNTANDAGAHGPDFLYGWGVANAYRAVRALQAEQYVEIEISQDDEIVIPIEVPDNTYAVKVMTYWPDPESFTTSNVLINDLNTELVGASETYMPFVLDYTPAVSNLAAEATRGVDSVNNVEQIEIINPAAGRYDLNITGHRVPMESARAYVTWEFISNDIEILYPSGGEHLTAGDVSYITWDAGGDDERFTVDLVFSNDSVRTLGSRSGNTRMLSWNPGRDYVDDAKIRITRGSQVVEGDSTFVIADRVEDLSLSTDGNTLLWDVIEGATTYNVYALIDKYMEVVATVDAAVYEIPVDGVARRRWVAVSPVFTDGREGMRSRAINTREPLVPTFVNADNDEPCEGVPTIFEATTNLQNVEHRWAFGNRATPSEAVGAGPHSVVYSRDGRASGRYFLSDEFGEESILFRMEVGAVPEIDDIEADEVEPQRYAFTADTDNADSFLWNFDDGSTSEEEEPIHTFTDPGTYEVTLTASSKCGEVTETIDIEVIIVSINETAPLDELVLSPNPTDGAFDVALPAGITDAVVELYSQDGKLITTQACGQAVCRLVAPLAGTYTVLVRTGDERVSKSIQVIR